uniref:Extensin-like n=1 Tax=Heterorhabditis bacteriophora TaxID=37862 RepID=A0A1I7X9L8_HETBA
MAQVISHDLNEVWDDISEFLDQENFRMGEDVSTRFPAFSPLETPTVNSLTCAPKMYTSSACDPPITLSMPPPTMPYPQNYSSLCAIVPTTSTLSPPSTFYVAPFPTIKEESPPSSPEIPYLYSGPGFSHSGSPLAYSLPDLHSMPLQRLRKVSRLVSFSIVLVFV